MKTIEHKEIYNLKMAIAEAEIRFNPQVHWRECYYWDGYYIMVYENNIQPVITKYKPDNVIIYSLN
jgi:hypothetical protein